MTDTSATSIDTVLANVKENIHASGVIHFGNSDHSLIYAVRKFMLPKTKTGVREIRLSRSNDPKKSWTLINTLLGKNSEPNNLSELSVNDNLVSDPKSMAVGLNDYFVNIGPALAAEYEEDSYNTAQMTNDNINSFPCAQFKFSPIPVDNVASTLRGLKANKTTGLDKIPPKTLKLSASIIAMSLMYIFNLSLATGIYLDD